MEKEENVYDTTLGTGEEVVKEDGVEKTAVKEASAVPEKFKDVDALARAYGALQAEFTRRSQRLKELERKMENLEDGKARLGAEKLRKNAQARKTENKRFETFLAETENRNTAQAVEVSSEEPMEEKQPSVTAEEENNVPMYEDNLPQTQAETTRKCEESGESENASAGCAEKGTELSVEKEMTAVNPSDALYAQVCRDENVRLKIIGEYLTSLGKSGVPLMRGGVGTLTTPPKKAADIAEAGNMALLYLKKPTVN